LFLRDILTFFQHPRSVCAWAWKQICHNSQNPGTLVVERGNHFRFGAGSSKAANGSGAGKEGDIGVMKRLNQVWRPLLLLCFAPMIANAQVEQGGGSFKVQCPSATVRHPGGTNTGGSGTVVTVSPDQAEAPHTRPSSRTASISPVRGGRGIPVQFGSTLTLIDNGVVIKCQQISSSDGYLTEGDFNQTFMFAFGPLSGLNAIENGQPGTQFPIHFNNPYCEPASPNGANYNSAQANPYCSGTTPTNPNGAVGDVRPPITEFRRSHTSVFTAGTV
jgi:hypothetical protein